MAGAFAKNRTPSYTEQMSGWLEGLGAPSGPVTDRVADTLRAPDRGADWMSNTFGYEPAKNLAAFPMDPNKETAKTTATEAALTFTPMGKIGAALSPLKSLFLSLPAIKRLTEAGKIKSGSWGSPEALEKANLRPDMSEDELAKAWTEHGWAPREMFGDKIPSDAERYPVSWYSFDWSPSKDLTKSLRSFVGGEKVEKLGSFFPHAADDLSVAHPSLGNLPTTMSVQPGTAARDFHGSNLVNIVSDPMTGLRKRSLGGFYLKADTPENAALMMRHEGQHGVDFATSKGLLDVRGLNKYGSDSDALDIVRKQIDDLKSRMKVAGDEGFDPDIYNAQLSQLAKLRMHEKALPTYSTYVTMPHEIAGRLANQGYRLSDDINDAVRNIPPSQWDAWANDSMAPVARDAPDLYDMKDLKARDLFKGRKDL